MYLEKKWFSLLQDEMEKPYMKELNTFLQSERKGNTPIFPPENLIYNAFCQTPFEEVKVVIIGQDPYHGKGQAHGLSFSVPEGILPPPSLKNIFKELKEDIGISIPSSGCLLPWAKQGVFLLNATLTVQEGKPKSHAGKGWEAFTDKVVEKLALRKDPLVFFLWGKLAQEKCENVFLGKNHPHLVLTAAHPSFFSASFGFFGCKHFSKANVFLEQKGKTPINWQVS
ncbi:MAG: uracil-DNA glycosylase [Chlamydiota bacterium]